MKNLINFRKEIDRIDNAIIELLGKRIEVVKEIGKYKKSKNLPYLDLSRFQKLLMLRQKKAKKLGIPEELIKDIYTLIHDVSLKIESKT